MRELNLCQTLADYVQILPISVITADNTPAHAAARSFASFLIDSRHSLHRRRSQLAPRQDVTQSPPKCFGGQLQGKIKLLIPVRFRAPQLLWCPPISEGH